VTRPLKASVTLTPAYACRREVAAAMLTRTAGTEVYFVYDVTLENKNAHRNSSLLGKNNKKINALPKNAVHCKLR